MPDETPANAPCRQNKKEQRRVCLLFFKICGNLYDHVLPFCLVQPLRGFGSHLYTAKVESLAVVSIVLVLYEQLALSGFP